MSSVLKWASKKGKQQEGKQWLHAPEALTQAAVVYSVKFLGVTEVSQPKGTEVIKEAITKVQFANHIKKSEAGTKASKLKKVDLKISIDAVKVDDAKTKEQLYAYPLHHISYCADDKRDKKVFAFIAKDKTSPQHSCYVFEGERLAEELTLTVGQAFDLAYRRFLERKGGVKPETQKHVTAMQQQIKDAEAEKEILKQKIAELERAQQGNASAATPAQAATKNGNEQQYTGQGAFNLLGDFHPIPSITPPPQHKRPAQDLGKSFDPLEQAFPPTQEPQANTSNPMDLLFGQPSGGTNSMASPFAQSPDGSNVFSSSFDQPTTISSPFDQPGMYPIADNLDPLDNISSASTAAAVPVGLFGEPVNNNNVSSIPQQAEVPRPNGSSAVPRPTSKTGAVPNLPPPPSKQSVKAAKLAAASAGGVPAPAPAPTPTPQAPSSHSNTDLFGLESPQLQANPFFGGPNFDDPFSDRDSFDPLDTVPVSGGATNTMDRQLQDLQDGFSREMVMDNNLFSS